MTGFESLIEQRKTEGVDYLLQSRYRRTGDFVHVIFWDNGESDYICGGDVSDNELEAVIYAEGRAVAGWVLD